jgi:hypothetical protein
MGFLHLDRFWIGEACITRSSITAARFRSSSIRSSITRSSTTMSSITRSGSLSRLSEWRTTLLLLYALAMPQVGGSSSFAPA